MSLRIAACILCVTSLACGKTESPAASAPAAAPSPEPAKAAPAPPAPAAPTDRVDDPTFELKATPVGAYAAGKLGSFAVSLRPRGEYHINQDYPMTIKVSGQGIAFPKSDFAKPDAAAFTEQAARFDVPFTPSAAGSHRVEANVKFAVCTPENCVPDERTLALTVAVQ